MKVNGTEGKNWMEQIDIFIYIIEEYVYIFRGWVWFVGILTFVSYLMPKTYLQKNNSDTN